MKNIYPESTEISYKLLTWQEETDVFIGQNIKITDYPFLTDNTLFTTNMLAVDQILQKIRTISNKPEREGPQPYT